ncbi:TPA: hypothetical protein WMV36_001565 [Neisseria gonorrhoeae]
MPSEPSDGIFNRPPFTGAGQVRGNTRTVIPDNTAISKPVIPDNTAISKPVIPDNTAISKPVIPAQAGIRTPDAAGIYRK